MKKVGRLWLIGGTGDSVTIAQTIRKHSFPCLVTVTTSTATNLYPTDLLISIQTDKLDTVGIQKLCYRETIKGIIDASHPFAINISRQAIQVARQKGIPYLRYERPNLTNNSSAIYLDSFEDLITGNYLQNKRVLLTIGCNNLYQFEAWHKQATLYTRILPNLNSLEMSLKAGFPASQIIALRPPISLELERALWQQWGINLVVTKASGKQGGENKKIQVAEELSIPLIIIKRPTINYPQQTEQLSDIIEFCYQCFPKSIMSDPITPAVSDRICKHMNDDHSNAIFLYAKIFGNVPETETAIMESIDPEGMNLSVKVKGENQPIRVKFDHVLKDSEDAHHTLIDMVKKARSPQN